MRRVLIGSFAARHWFRDFREPGEDRDYLVEGKSGRDGTNEYHDCTKSAGLMWIFENCHNIAYAEDLYTLKLSHCFWDIHWVKTMHDIAFFQANYVKLNGGLFELLYKGWEEIHGSKRAMLAKSNEDFFDDAVERVYVHDDLHEAIAYGERPMYESVKNDKDKAMLSHDLFLNLSKEDQFKLCREEIYVTALERFLIPSNFTRSLLVAYRGACRLLLTSMTKGWFPKFIAANWYELCRPDDHDFVGLFHKRKDAIRCLPQKTHSDG